MFNVEKIFKNETAIGRLDFFYIALMFVLWFLQSVPIFLSTTLRSVASCVFASFIALACIVSLFWYLIAVYKRLYSIFDKMIVCILLTIVVVVSILQPLLFLILNILLILIPAKKEITSIFHPMYTIKARIFLLFVYCLNIFNVIHVFGILSSVSPDLSMKNIFQETDKIAISVFGNKYKRGDIVAISGDRPYFVRASRIVGLPNEKVEIKSFDDGAKYVYVNDKKLEEPYVVDNYNYLPCVESNSDEIMSIKCSAVVVPKDSYYILPDDRSSIYIAYHDYLFRIVSKGQIKGRIVRIWYPFDRIRNL